MYSDNCITNRLHEFPMNSFHLSLIWLSFRSVGHDSPSRAYNARDSRWRFDGGVWNLWWSMRRKSDSFIYQMIELCSFHPFESQLLYWLHVPYEHHHLHTVGHRARRIPFLSSACVAIDRPVSDVSKWLISTAKLKIIKLCTPEFLHSF